MKITAKLSANTRHEKMYFLVPTIIVSRSWGVLAFAVTWLTAAHLQDLRGVLQVDGYAGFERLASKPHRLFEILWRLQHPSGQFLYDFKEMLLMLTYLAAVVRLFWLMGKVSTHAWPK